LLQLPLVVYVLHVKPTFLRTIEEKVERKKERAKQSLNKDVL